VGFELYNLYEQATNE